MFKTWLWPWCYWGRYVTFPESINIPLKCESEAPVQIKKKRAKDGKSPEKDGERDPAEKKRKNTASEHDQKKKKKKDEEESEKWKWYVCAGFLQVVFTGVQARAIDLN